MSFLDVRDRRSGWIAAAPLQRSVRQVPGCVQCGSRLELDPHGRADDTAKCINCQNFVSDEDEAFDELESY